TFWRWKPVGFLVRTGVFALEVKVQRSVRVKPERHPTADGKPIERVSNLESLVVIKRDRPEGVHRRRVTFVEVKLVFVRSVQRPPGIIGQIDGINRILGKVRPETGL